MKVSWKAVPQWKRCGCQQLRTKSAGHTDVVVGMMLFFILLAVILFSFRCSQYMVTAAGVEDALAASNLASAVIDLEEYGRSHKILISDEAAAFEIYRDALCYNLGLDEYLNTTNQDFLSDRVEIKTYMIYNACEDVVEIVTMDGAGNVLKRETGSMGMVFTPDNRKVETTTIYSRVGFWVEGLMGQRFYAEKGKSIDIMRCDSE